MSNQEIKSRNWNLFTRDINMLNTDAVFNKIANGLYSIFSCRGDYEFLIVAFLRMTLGINLQYLLQWHLS
jgi:hypothetical protein